MPKAKPYTGAIPPELAEQVLNSTGVMSEGVLLGTALKEAVLRLEACAKLANEALSESVLAEVISTHLAEKAGKRGNSSVSVNAQGQMLLHVAYSKKTPAQKKAAKAEKMPLPRMSELRERARNMGVDISRFGSKRTEILQFLDEQSATISPVAPVTFVGQEEEEESSSKTTVDPGPMSAGPDEVRVSPLPDDPKPPKRKGGGFVKTSQSLTPPVVVEMGEESSKASKPSKSRDKNKSTPNLSDLVSKSKGVSITDLLDSDAPE